MVYGGIAFQCEQLLDMYAARHTAAPEVVAQQVHNHQVFGTVLGAFPQCGGALQVTCRVGKAGTGAFYRARFYLLPLQGDEALR